MVVCLTAARFTMQAEILTQVGADPVNFDEDPENDNLTLESYQDPITGAILNRWVQTDNQSVPLPEGSLEAVRTIPCLARGITGTAIARTAGSSEDFGDTYENIEIVRMWVPASVRLSKRDRVTNIRARKGGAVVWIDEEYGDRPTVFNVDGVVPEFDPMNNHVQNLVMLNKVDY
jgi:hypothetical protein